MIEEPDVEAAEQDELTRLGHCPEALEDGRGNVGDLTTGIDDDAKPSGAVGDSPKHGAVVL
jgi:hypothetical protein